jgi:hypothetical protein
MRKAMLGVGVALAVALIAADANILGIAAWKIVLAAIGLALIVSAGPLRDKPVK